MVPQFTPFGTDRAYLLGRKLLADDRTTQGTVTSDPEEAAMAIHRHSPRARVAVTTRTPSLEQHFLSASMLAIAVVAVLLTLAG